MSSKLNSVVEDESGRFKYGDASNGGDTRGLEFLPAEELDVRELARFRIASGSGPNAGDAEVAGAGDVIRPSGTW